MGRQSKRKQAARAAHRRNTGQFGPQSEPLDPDVVDVTMDVDESPFDEPCFSGVSFWEELLVMPPNAAIIQNLNRSRRSYYDGTSQRTKRRKKAMIIQAHMSCPMKTLDAWFDPCDAAPPVPVVSVCRTLLECLESLNEVLKDKKKSAHEFAQLVVLAKFFEFRLNGATRHDASTSAATLLPSAFQLGPRTVQNWCKAYQFHGCLPGSRRGQHKKTPSLIHDEDFLRKCGHWLRSTRPSMRSPRTFRVHLNDVILPELTGAVKSTVSEATARRWMIHAGYKYGSWKKDVYIDGHERDDVVEYRKSFCSTWIALSDRMASYSGDTMETADCPTAEEVVWVTHDESIFYANDDGGMVWTNAAHPDLPKKGRGRSVMVSEFLCPCHGRLYTPSDNGDIFVIETLHVGKAQEGYWTSTSFDRCRRKFSRHSPHCTLSTYHAAFAVDALRANSMNLNPGGKQPKLRDGWYKDSGGRVAQAMSFPDDHSVPALRGAPKGIKAVLAERGSLKDPMLLICGATVQMPSGPELLECCARHRLASYPDFRSQKSILEETVIAAGHKCMFFPKYHCELNPIESFWGAAKRHARSNCDFSWGGLVQCVPHSLDSVPLVSIRKFFRRCSHFIQAYSYGLDYAMSKYAHKQYKSHRRIPESIELHNNYK
ncbi:hypothetical protein AaE_016253 [Aphanomyces astaci]|uniref:Tc1-like transposase DDE domain-containing protein n=1 Tax=Aphanomyces astaci TaxID=112090 RepID=A0A6A4YTZ1_APHAT|nr:hypothetical protein AaE_016253 [Aphanomyces astaci]